MKTEHLVKDRKKGCPFGKKKCDDCNLYVPMYLTELSGEVTQQYNCTFNNIAVLLGETKDRSLGLQQAIESFRNETVKRQDTFIGMAHQASQARLKGNGNESRRASAHQAEINQDES